MSLNTSINYSYLRIPDDVTQNVKHKPNEIYQWDATNTKIIRNIYNNQPFEQIEQTFLSQLIEDLKKSNINYQGIINTDADLLRFHKYSKDIHETISNIAYYTQYMMDPNKINLTKSGKNALENGIVYLGGRDKKYRPTLMINVQKIDISKSDSISGFQNALIYLVKKIEDNLLSPGYVENMNVIIEANAVEKTLQIQPIRELINLVTKLFPARVNLIFILNLSEQIMKKNLKIIESCLHIEQKNSIKLLSSNNSRELRKHYHAAELEQKYGGIALDIEQFWPPLNLVNQSFYYQANNNTSMASQAPLNSSNLMNKSQGSIIVNDYPTTAKFLETVKEIQEPNEPNKYSGLEGYEFQYLKESQDPLLQQYAKSNASFNQQSKIMENQNQNQSVHQIEQNNSIQRSEINEDIQNLPEKKDKQDERNGFLCGLCYRSKKTEEEQTAKDEQQQEQVSRAPSVKPKKERNQNGPCLIF